MIDILFIEENCVTFEYHVIPLMCESSISEVNSSGYFTIYFIYRNVESLFFSNGWSRVKSYRIFYEISSNYCYYKHCYYTGCAIYSYLYFRVLIRLLVQVTLSLFWWNWVKEILETVYDICTLYFFSLHIFAIYLDKFLLLFEKWKLKKKFCENASPL